MKAEARYYRSGSSFPRYRKPAQKILSALRVDKVQHTGHRTWLVEFKDGMGVTVREAEHRGRFYTFKLHDRVRYYEEARPEPSQALAHAYQYVALTRIVPAQSAFHVQERTGRYSEMGRTDLFADVHEELYPSRDARRPRVGSRDPARGARIDWHTSDLSRQRVEGILGKEWVARFFDLPKKDAIARAQVRARGAWNANEREHQAAYLSLARLLSSQSGSERDPRSRPRARVRVRRSVKRRRSTRR